MATHPQVKLVEKHQLTFRELQVLELICQGHSTKQIAALLGISFKTAASHRQRLLDKAGAHNPIRLLRWALEKGHIRLDHEPSPD
jgi:DNA-binding NarL/FixJ family response regulator